MAMEATEMVCTCCRDPHRHAHSVSGCLLHDPTRITTLKQASESLLLRIRDNMKRWSSRYAESEHAQKHVKETRLLIQEIDEVILRR